MGRPQQAAPVAGIEAARDPNGILTLKTALTVLGPGSWTPAASNSLEAAMLLQLQSHQDDYPDSLQMYVQSVDVIYTAARNKDARQLLNSQVKVPALPFSY